MDITFDWKVMKIFTIRQLRQYLLQTTNEILDAQEQELFANYSIEQIAISKGKIVEIGRSSLSSASFGEILPDGATIDDHFSLLDWVAVC